MVSVLRAVPKVFKKIYDTAFTIEGGKIMRTERSAVKGLRRRVIKKAPIPTNVTCADSLKKELDGWLSCRDLWNHDEWLTLLSDLRSKGYNDLIDTPKGRDAIGLYLETNKPRS